MASVARRVCKLNAPAVAGLVFLDQMNHNDYGYNRFQNMTPQAALDEQIERYRRMTGEQRLAIALALHQMSCNIAREGIRRQHPDADESQVERFLRERLELARGA